MNDRISTVPGVGEVIALLGRGSSFEGKLTFEGAVRIDGVFTGEIFSDDTLIIGEGGQVKAEVEVGRLILQGNLVGNVRAADVVDLRAPGRLEGNITAPNVMMEKGAFFEGACTMTPPAAPRQTGWGQQPPSGPQMSVPQMGGPQAIPTHGPQAVPAQTLAPVAPPRQND